MLFMVNYPLPEQSLKIKELCARFRARSLRNKNLRDVASTACSRFKHRLSSGNLAPIDSQQSIAREGRAIAIKHSDFIDGSSLDRTELACRITDRHEAEGSYIRRQI